MIKLEPLKGKYMYDVNLRSYPDISAQDVKSAVEWLKKENMLDLQMLLICLKNIPFDERRKIRRILEKILIVNIDEAFEDVIEK